MSLSFLSRQDVESWVPQPGPSKGGAGFVAKLFTTISRAMASLTSVLSTTKGGTHQRCRNEFERFFLWGQGLSIVDGDLDEVLADSKELHFRVLSLLLRLGTAVLQGLSRDPVPSSQVLAEQCDDLRILLDATETLLQEPEPYESARPYPRSESDASEHEETEILEEISVYVDCLLDLSPSLDNPALDIQVEGSDEPPTQEKESFAVSSEEAEIYCRKIRDRFEVLPKNLVELLAEANVLRAAALRKMRSRPTKHEAPISEDITESLFSTTDRRFTETTKSTVPLSSVFSSAVERPPRWSKAAFSGHAPVREFDDNASEVTFASFSTAVSAVSLGRPRVPPMPKIQGDGFNCPICFSRVTNAKTRKEWKKHVFDDLKPYVCTVEDCKDRTMLYNHSGMWAQHETSHPSSALRSSECSFCSAIYQHRGPAYHKHVSAHLREVSLSVLPQPADEGHDGFDTDDSYPPPSDRGSEQVRPDTNVDKEAEPKKDLPVGGAEAEGYKSQLPLSAIPSITSPDRYPTPGGQSGPYSPPAAKAEPGPIADASATSQKGTPSTEKTESTSESASALASVSQAAAESASNTDEVDLDSIIDHLLKVRGCRPGKLVQIREDEIRYLCTKAREVFISQPILLELEAPVKVVGDMHGQYCDLLRTFEYGGFPPEANYVFLGNYVDYGKQSLEVICLILAYKIKYPENFFPLRGNHECASMTRIYGFYYECKKRYNIKLWKTFTDTFNCMPIAAIISGKIFCIHGGLSPDLNSMEQIRRIMRPTDVPDCGLLYDLLWSNPEIYETGWSTNDPPGDGNDTFTFGPDVVSRFLQKHDMDLIVRGHQVVEDGYEFFANRQLVTLWGAPNYSSEFDNAAAMMNIDETLLCSFQILKPAEKKQRFGRS